MTLPKEIDMSIDGPGGLKLKNPIAAANGHLTAWVKTMERCIDAGASLVDVKTATSLKQYHVVLRGGVGGFLDKYGLRDGSYHIATPGSAIFTTLDDSVELIKGIKPYAKKHGVLVVGSYVDPAENIEAYRDAAVAIEKAGADIFKLFPLCPWVMGAGPTPDFLENVGRSVKAVREALSIPMIAKWATNWSISDLMAGLQLLAPVVDGFELQAGCPTWIIDVEKAQPLSPLNWFHGHGTRTFGVNTTYEAYRYLKNLGRNVPICSSAGISTWRDAVERMMVGATYVNLHTAVHYRGYRVFTQIIDGMNEFLASHGYNKAKDIVGKVTPWMNNPEWQAEWIKKHAVPKEKVTINIDPAACNGCKRCQVCILEAIDVVDGIAKVDLELCERCGLCKTLCPRNAISLEIVV